MIVLDTNIVIRIMMGQGKIGPDAKRTLDGIAERRCSAMVHWELAMLAGKGKMAFDMPLHAWMEKAAGLLHFAETPVTGSIARDAGSLPGSIHGDPCDRIMIATARDLMCPIITTDRLIFDYAQAGHVQAIDARR